MRGYQNYVGFGKSGAVSFFKHTNSSIIFFLILTSLGEQNTSHQMAKDTPSRKVISISHRHPLFMLPSYHQALHTCFFSYVFIIFSRVFSPFILKTKILQIPCELPSRGYVIQITVLQNTIFLS